MARAESGGRNAMAQPCRLARGRAEVAHDKPPRAFFTRGDWEATTRERTTLNEQELAMRPHLSGRQNVDGGRRSDATLAWFARRAVLEQPPAARLRPQRSLGRCQSAHSEKTLQFCFFAAQGDECAHACLRLIQSSAMPLVAILRRAHTGRHAQSG